MIGRGVADGLRDFQILYIQHIDEAFECQCDLVDFTRGQPIEPVDNLVLYGRGGIFSEVLPALGQLNRDHPAVMGYPQSFHKTLALQTVDDPRDRARIDHHMPGDLGRGQGTIFVQGDQAVDLGRADVVNLVQLFGIVFSRLHQPADGIYDLLGPHGVNVFRYFRGATFIFWGHDDLHIGEICLSVTIKIELQATK